MKLYMNMSVRQSVSYRNNEVVYGYASQSVSQSAIGTMKLSMNMPVSQSVSYRNNEVVYGYASQSVSQLQEQ